jgi:hypothetical protein
MGVIVIGDGLVVAAQAVLSDDATLSVAVPPRTTYVRAQLVNARGEIVALTSPIWLS